MNHAPFTKPVRFDFQEHILNFDGYIAVKWDDPEESHLHIDLQTAAILKKIHDACNETNQEKMIELCNAEKWRFCHLVDKAWKLVQ